MKKIFIVTFFLICSFILGYLFNSNNDNYERYKIYQHPNIRADKYLLDSKTGIVWNLVEDNNKVLIWEPMMKISTDIELVDRFTNNYLNEKEKENKNN